MADLRKAASRLDRPGTPESQWQACPKLRRLRPGTAPTPPSGRCLVVAPHPDDEILGAGGTSALLASAGVEIVLIAVTDGENSHPHRRVELRQRRPLESAAAAGRLGIFPLRTVRLGHPDGSVAEGRLMGQLAELLHAGDVVLAPWCHDGHPDHDRAGRAARGAADRCRALLLSYLVWTWHWASPDTDLPWNEAVRVELGPELTARKRSAIRCFTSQITGPDPILTPAALDHMKSCSVNDPRA
jgi:LmbE family N-acetylglucosaminyl deacetylase